MRMREELTGQKFGCWTVLGYLGSSQSQKRVWRCECVCGYIGPVVTSKLKKIPKGCTKCNPRKTRPHGQAALNRTYSQYKRNASLRGLVFDLSKNDFINITQQNCHYCGALPSPYLAHLSVNNGVFIGNGIDRKQNDIGYTLENCLPCCRICNKAKMDKGYDEYISWLHCSSDYLRGR